MDERKDRRGGGSTREQREWEVELGSLEDGGGSKEWSEEKERSGRPYPGAHRPPGGRPSLFGQPEADMPLFGLPEADGSLLGLGGGRRAPLRPSSGRRASLRPTRGRRVLFLIFFLFVHTVFEFGSKLVVLLKKNLCIGLWR